MKKSTRNIIVLVLGVVVAICIMLLISQQNNDTPTEPTTGATLPEASTNPTAPTERPVLPTEPSPTVAPTEPQTPTTPTTQPPHVHNYNASATAPTCEVDGFTTYTCICGDSYIDDITAPLGHDYGSWEVSVSASCEVDGKEIQTCSRCGGVNERDIAASGHSYQTTVTAPTCVEPGNHINSCSTCGHEIVEIVDAIGHIWNEWTQTKAPTETEPGQECRACTTCGEIEVREIAALGHAHAYVEVITVPTCTEAGYTTYACGCGYTYQDSPVNALGHSYDKTVVDATCTADGYTIYTCSVCGDTYQSDKVSTVGHQYTITVINPTCTTNGKTTFFCTVCNHSYEDEQTSALGHSWSDWVVTVKANCKIAGEQMRNCDRCEQVETKVIDIEPCTKTTVYATVNADVNIRKGPGTGYGKVGTLASGSTVEIMEQKTLSNGQVWGQYSEGWIRLDGYAQLKSETIFVSGNYHTEVTSPTCTNAGFTIYSCPICTTAIKSDEIDALGHANSEWEVVKAATCAQNGQELSWCTRCGEYQTRETDALGHAYTNWIVDFGCLTGGQKTRQCIYCQMEEIVILEPTGHEWYFETIVAATETTEGMCKQTCSVCDETIYYSHKLQECSAGEGSKFRKVKSDYGPDGKLWTEDDSWYNDYYCYICEKVFYEYVCGYHKHEWTEEVYIEPTCTSNARFQQMCLICGGLKDHEENNTSLSGTLKHCWSAFVTTLEPSVHSVGYEQRTCSACGTVEGYAIPALDPVTGTRFETYIAPEVTVENTASIKHYHYKSIELYDRRDWNNDIIILVNEEDGLDVAYYNESGEIIAFRLRQVAARDFWNAMGHAPDNLCYISEDSTYDARVDLSYWEHEYYCGLCNYPLWYKAGIGELACIRSSVDDVCLICGEIILANTCHLCVKVPNNDIPSPGYRPPVVADIEVDALFPRALQDDYTRNSCAVPQISAPQSNVLVLSKRRKWCLLRLPRYWLPQKMMTCPLGSSLGAGLVCVQIFWDDKSCAAVHYAPFLNFSSFFRKRCYNNRDILHGVYYIVRTCNSKFLCFIKRSNII